MTGRSARPDRGKGDWNGADAGDVAAALRQIATPAGLPGSGRLRYAAAMTLHAAGLIGFETLEVYRILAMTDAEDPLRLLATRRLRPPPAPADDPAAALDDLAEATDAWLSGCRRDAGDTAALRRALAAARLAAPPRARGDGLPPGIAATLPAALADVADRMLARALAAAAPLLGWRVGRTGTARAGLLGPDAAFASDRTEIAIVLMAGNADPPTDDFVLPLSQDVSVPVSRLVLCAGRRPGQ